MTGTGESRRLTAEDERTTGSAENDDADDADETNGFAPSESPSGEDDHLEDLKDGAGCTEIWEHLSENRDG
ncbi:hypothetical protein [Halorubrum cibi]|uniref:Uncharacterized protein n=1 Tax=Halorubrum cibi TaxID=413815 RepID=A0A521BXB6_9EURY|nr:hypothetical protein [Halorubrum cibi]SMO51844.1 hypothetical protein SAMN06264867_103151 [Halorubrum cibi]